jgi:hypothetical protein
MQRLRSEVANLESQLSGEELGVVEALQRGAQALKESER